MRRDRPIVCLVTDRRRTLARDPRAGGTHAALVRLAREAVDAGIDLLQIREPGLETAELVDLVAAFVEAARGSATRVVVNDRLDVALAAGADGVHLRGDSIPPQSARAMAPPGFVIGRSIHQIGEARDHAPSVDYLIAGTVFPTGSKPSDAPLLGVRGLREIAAAVAVPVLAIGGVTLQRLRDVVAAGGAGIAAISLFLPRDLPLAAVVGAVRAQFDSIKTAS
jgi:thiamine-phosphate pyrophosphorylase